MSGLTEAEMLKTNTIMGIIMGTAGLIACIIGAVCAALVGFWALNAGQIFLAVVMGFFAYANFVNQNMPGGVTRD